MANTYKNIVITPNRDTDAANVPFIRFSGGDATTNTDINVRVYTTQSGTLSFEGSAGQLFSITNDLTNTIFSVNDVSGIPSVEIDAAGLVKLTEFGGNVAVGRANANYKVDVVGSVNASALFINGSPVTFSAGSTGLTPSSATTGAITLAGTLAVGSGGTGATNAATARTNLGLGTIATQAASSVSITGGSITGITDLAVADGGTGASDAGTARTNLGLGTIATQAASSVSITGGSITGITDLAVADGGTGASDAGTARTNLGLGTIATQAASSVSITGGSITGITDLAVADGGTGASDAATARTNLGLAIGTNVQAYDADLAAIAALAPTADNFIVGNGTTWVLETPSDARTSLGLGTMSTQGSGTVSITGGSITGITDLAIADGGTGASDAGTARTNLGLGTIATQAASSVSITGGSVTGITDLAIADGGTGASDAGTARTNLGLAIGTNVQAYSARLGEIAALATTTDNFIVANGTSWVLETPALARTSLGLGTIATQAASSVSITGGSITGITDLAVADGGTGASDAGTARTNLGLGTISTQAASSVSITGGSITGITDLAVADGGTGASDAGTARTNLGLAIGTNVQAWDTNLDQIAALAPTADNFIVGDGTSWTLETPALARTSLGLGTIATQAASSVAITGGSITGITDLAVADGGTGASDAGTARTNLGLGTIATQAASLVSITGGSITGITDLAVADGGTGASDAGTARTNLGLGTIATQAASSVSITGGSITGITDLAVADGGTGASDAGTARTNLGLGTIATQAASSVSITGGSITGITDLAVADGGTGASDAATARTNLGLGTIATQSNASVNITGGSITGITDLAIADGGTGASEAANARTNLGLAIGTNVQAYDADLAAIAALAPTADNFIVGNGTTWVLETPSDARTSLGLGTIATQAASSVSITGGSITGITDLAVVDGGTGASDAGTARTNLGLAIGTNVQAYDADLAAIAALTPTLDNFIVGNGTTWTLETPALARTSLGLVIGTNVQAWDTNLDQIAALAPTADNFIVGDGTSWTLETPSAARTSLGLGTIATQAASSVAITGGTITGITDLQVATSSNLLIGRTTSTVGLNTRLDVNGAVNASAFLVNGVALTSGGGGGVSNGKSIILSMIFGR